MFKHSKIVLLLLCVVLASALAAMTVTTQQTSPMTPTGEQPWDFRNVTQAGQFSFYDMPPGASATGKPVDAGDFDGNGCGDLAITGQNATHSLLGAWRGSNGHVRILMNVCEIGGVLMMNTPPETHSHKVFTLFGAYAGDMAGTETYIADFNGDGYDDLLFSAQNSDGLNQGRSNAGAIYILFGSPDFAQQGDIDLRSLPDNMMVFHGADAEDRLGLWVEGGDFDGDGFHDILAGANQADGIDNRRANAGEVWIIYGAADMIALYGQVSTLANPIPNATQIIGADYDDLLGSCVWGDDLNGDGYDDAIVSASLWRASAGVGGLSFGGGDGPGNIRYNSGEVFIIFGSPDLRGQIIDLTEKVDEAGHPIDDSITVIYGPEANDLLGEEIAVGDMTGNGQNDLVLGTLIGDGPENNMDEAGEAWVIYTHEPFTGQMIDLADPEPGRTVVIYPDQADSKAGDTLRVADIDGDGIADLFYGAPDYDPTGYDERLRPNAGMLAVIMGEPGGFPNDDGKILLFDPPEGLRVRFIVGADDNDMMPYAMAVYDMDGDGVIDIIPNAMGGDGDGNRYTNAGEIYIISGAEFLSDTHDYLMGYVEDTTSITPTPYPTSTPVPEATVAASGVGNVGTGRLLFVETCAGCHGFLGEGVEGLGLALPTSPLILYSTDEELLRFLKQGRPADHPENVTGVSMPASGGRPDWMDGDLLDVIAYLRLMRDTATEE